MSILGGCATAMITPFHQGEIDFEVLGRLVDRQVEERVSIVACGTTAETATMSSEEYESVLRFIISRVEGRVPVFAGCGSNSTRKAIENARLCEELGADGLLIVTPYYNKTTQAGLIAHYQAIAGETSLPILLYNVPGRTGLNMQAETVAELSRVPNIVGVKEAGSSITQVGDIIRLSTEGFEVYSGNDDMIIPMMSLGAKGVISVVANLLPGDTREMVELFQRGQVSEAARRQLGMNELIGRLFIETNPIPVKQAMAWMELCSEEVRLPLIPMQEGNKRLLQRAMESYGLLENIRLREGA